MIWELTLLDETDRHYSKIEDRFFKGWKKTSKKEPYIHNIYKVPVSSKVLGAYRAYRDYLVDQSFYEKRPPTKDEKVFFANEQYLFHGTHRDCRLGESPRHDELCDSDDCSLCSIIQKSFDIRLGERDNKFGAGIYTTSCSAKSDGYVSNGHSKAKLHAMLVCLVAVGDPYCTKKLKRGLTKPPKYYDSVVGEPGEDLTTQETVVYRKDAIRPAFLVVYGNSPPR